MAALPSRAKRARGDSAQPIWRRSSSKLQRPPARRFRSCDSFLSGEGDAIGWCKQFLTSLFAFGFVALSFPVPARMSAHQGLRTVSKSAVQGHPGETSVHAPAEWRPNHQLSEKDYLPDADERYRESVEI